MIYPEMGDKNDKKKTKDEFTSFLLNDEAASQKTNVLPAVPEAPLAAPASPPQDTAKIDKAAEKVAEKMPEEKPASVTQIKPAEKSRFKLKPILESVKNQFEKSEKSERSEKLEKSKNEFLINKDNIDPSLFSLEAALKQSEYLRLAQSKVRELEKKLFDVLKENESLSASAIVLQKKHDQMVNQLDVLKQDHKAQIENYKDELVLKDKVIKAMEKEREELLKKQDELKTLMGERVQQIRVRERELENRLEILQHEGDVVITTKDENILELKKQIDQLNYELENFKIQSRELNKDLQNQREQMRRSIKALRLALSLLENQELDGNELKKTGS
jgi:hypothetical protein